VELKQYKYLNIFIAGSVAALFIAFTFAYRLVEIGPFIEPGGTLTFPLSYLAGDIVAEVYGYKIARQMIWINILCLLFYVIMSAITIHMPFPSFWHDQDIYHKVFGLNFRLFVAFTLGLLISDFINIYAISKWKILTRGKYFWVRSIGSTAIGEFSFSLITDFIVFFGIVPFVIYLKIAMSAFCFKVIYTAVFSFPATVITNFMKKAEKIDVYDYETNFTPFRLSCS
jgi:uncharacterized integral membrane protein (TIGR00697 family)